MMTQTCPTHLRRSHPFQFSLRALLVLIAGTGCISAWLVYERENVRQRQNMLNWIRNNAHGRLVWSDKPAAWHRRVLGDVSIEVVSLPSHTDEGQIARVERLFPESQIDLYDGFSDGASWEF